MRPVRIRRRENRCTTRKGHLKMTDESTAVDISNDNLDLHRLSDGAFARFTSNKRGYTAMRKWIRAAPPAHFGYESTATYLGAFEAALVNNLLLFQANPKTPATLCREPGTTGQGRPRGWAYSGVDGRGTRVGDGSSCGQRSSSSQRVASCPHGVGQVQGAAAKPVTSTTPKAVAKPEPPPFARGCI